MAALRKVGNRSPLRILALTTVPTENSIRTGSASPDKVFGRDKRRDDWSAFEKASSLPEQPPWAPRRRWPEFGFSPHF